MATCRAQGLDTSVLIHCHPRRPQAGWQIHSLRYSTCNLRCVRTPEGEFGDLKGISYRAYHSAECMQGAGRVAKMNYSVALIHSRWLMWFASIFFCLCLSASEAASCHLREVQPCRPPASPFPAAGFSLHTRPPGSPFASEMPLPGPEARMTWWSSHQPVYLNLYWF